MTHRIATTGCFDGVHLGHRLLLDRLLDHARRLHIEPMVVTFDRHPLELIAPQSAPPMLSTIAERIEAIRGAGIDHVELLPFDLELRNLTAAQFMTMLRERYGVTHLLRGFNHHFGSDRLRLDADYDAAARAAAIASPLLRCPACIIDDITVSSTEVRRAIAEGDVTLAARLLGHPYSIAGSVVHGQALGRTIGFPTANIDVQPPTRALPAAGVYAVDVHLPDGSRRRGVLNIGHRPTVTAGSHAVTVEAHIIDYEADLYGTTLRIDLLRRLRPEQRFDSLAALRTQIAADTLAAKAL